MARRRWWLIGLMGVGGVAGLTLATLGGVAFWLSTDAGSAWARDKAIEAADGALPGDLSIGTLDVRLLRGITAKDVVLKGGDGAPLASVRSLSLRYDLGQLATRKLRVRSLAIEGVDVAMAMAPDGQIDLLTALGVPPTDPDAPVEPAEPWAGIGDFTVQVDEIALRDVTFAYLDAVTAPDAPTEVRVEGASLVAGLTVAGNRVEVPSLRFQTRVAAPVETPVGLDAKALFADGDLTLDALSLRLDATAVELSGRVGTVETDPVLDLQARIPAVDVSEVNRLAGQEVLSSVVGLQASVSGPLRDLVAGIDLDGAETGGLHLDAKANVQADPLTWSVALSTPRFDLQPLLPAVTEPVVIDGDWAVDGQGTTWPAGISATFTVTTHDQILWGEPVRELQLGGRLDAGVVTLQRLSATHPVGTVSAEGNVDLNASSASVFVNAGVPTLTALSRFGVAGAGGRAGFSGSVDARWGADPVEVDVSGQLTGGGISYRDADVVVSSLVVPVSASVRGEDVSARGSLVATNIVNPNAGVAELRLPAWTAQVRGGGSTEVNTDLDAAGLSVGGGAVQLDSIRGVATGGVDARGKPFATADVLLSDLLFGDSSLQAEGGPVVMQFGDDALTVNFNLARKDQPFFGGSVAGSLTDGRWSIADLVLAPLSDSPWHAASPVTFTLADGGVRDLSAALSSDNGSVSASGTWIGPQAQGTSLTLEVAGLDLAAVAKIVDDYVPPAEGETSPLAGLSGELDLLATLDDGSLSQGARVGVDAKLVGLTYPGAVTGAYIALEVGGHLGRPEVALSVSHESTGTLARVDGSAPLTLVGGLPEGVACGETADLSAKVLPGSFNRFEELLGDPGLPPGQLSAEVRAKGDICDPRVELVGAAEVEAGLRGERLRFDLEGLRDGKDVHLRAEMEESLVRRLTVDVNAETRIHEVLAGLLAPAETSPTAEEAAQEPDLALPGTWIERFDVSVVPMELPLATAGRLATLPPTVSGILGGGLNVRGTPDEPVIEGALLLVDGQVGRALIEQLQVSIEPGAQGGGYDVALLTSFGDRGELGGLKAQGFIPLNLNLNDLDGLDLEQDGLALDLSGEGLPLSLLVGVVDGIPEADGRLAINGDVGGSLASPEFKVNARLEQASLTYEDLGLRFHDIDMNVLATPELVHLRRLLVKSTPLYGLASELKGKGDGLQLFGKVKLQDLQPVAVDMDLQADRFWLSSSDDAKLELDADVKISGDYPAVAVTGDAKLLTGELTLSEEVFKEGSSLQLDPILNIHRKRAVAKARDRSGPSVLDELTVDLKVDLHTGLSLSAAIPTATDYGDQFAQLSTVGVNVDLLSPQPLVVQMRGGSPAVYGPVEMNRGDLNIMGKSFAVAPGSSVGFDGDVADPILDITASHRTAQYGDIDVEVTGSVSDPGLDFSSEEYPDKTDVMAILVLGKPPSDMSESEGQMGGALLGAALGSVANSLTRTVSGAFFGQIEIDGDSFRMGVPVARSVFATMEVRSTDDEDENSLQMTLEWLLGSNLSAELVTGDQAATSADVYYRWRF